jgi:hypothetical protein
MTPKLAATLHTLVGMAAQVFNLEVVPAPYKLYVGALFAGLTAVFAFLDQSLSQPSQPQ